MSSVSYSVFIILHGRSDHVVIPMTLASEDLCNQERESTEAVFTSIMKGEVDNVWFLDDKGVKRFFKADSIDAIWTNL